MTGERLLPRHFLSGLVKMIRPKAAPSRLDPLSYENLRQHLLQLFRRQLHDDKSRCKLRRLSQRLLKLRHELDSLADAEK